MSRDVEYGRNEAKKNKRKKCFYGGHWSSQLLLLRGVFKVFRSVPRCFRKAGTMRHSSDIPHSRSSRGVFQSVK